jgi:hypothetical protein
VRGCEKTGLTVILWAGNCPAQNLSPLSLKNVRLLRSSHIGLLIALSLFFSCRIEPHSRLYQCNKGEYFESLPAWLTVPGQTGNIHSFRIRHAQVKDLSTCWMGILVESKVVYWDWYQKDVSCRVEGPVKDLVVYLYDARQRQLYSWKDSSVYKLSPGPAGNLEIELSSF